MFPISTTQHLEEYFAYSRTLKKGYGERKITGAETLSSSYLDKQYRQLRRFWAWMVEAKWVPVNVNVLDSMQRPRVEEKVVPTVSDEQIQDLLAILDPRLARTQVEKFHLLRNSAVIRLFVDTLGRLQEIAMMEVTDLFLEDKGDERIQVMGKGRRQRFMPIRRAAGRVLADYLEARERLFPVTHDLWVSDQGEAMEVNWLYLMVKRVREARKCSTPASPYVPPYLCDECPAERHAGGISQDPGRMEEDSRDLLSYHGIRGCGSVLTGP